MLIIRKLVIFIILILLPPFIIEFIFFWPPADVITGIGVYLMILSVVAAIITASSRIIGFDLDSLFVTDDTDGQTFSSNIRTNIEKRLSETELASEFTERDGPIRSLIMALIPTFAKPPLAKLTLYSDSKNLSNEISLSGGNILRIGRHRTLNDIVIADKKISREHALIIIEKDGFYIEDQNSSNGTCVNNKRLSSSDRHQLRDGDIVNFGPIAYQFEFLEEAAENSLEDTDLPTVMRQDVLNGLSIS